MTLLAVFFAGAIFASAVGWATNRWVWSKSRRAILNGTDAVLSAATFVRGQMEYLKTQDAPFPEGYDLALVDLSEQESKLRWNRLVVRWL